MEKINFTDPAFPFLELNGKGESNVSILAKQFSEIKVHAVTGVNIGTLLSALAMQGLLSNPGLTNGTGAGLDKKLATEYALVFAEALIDQINKKYSTEGRAKYRRPLG